MLSKLRALKAEGGPCAAGEQAPKDVQDALAELNTARNATSHVPSASAASPAGDSRAVQELKSVTSAASTAVPTASCAGVLPGASACPRTGDAESPCNGLDSACADAPNGSTGSRSHPLRQELAAPPAAPVLASAKTGEPGVSASASSPHRRPDPEDWEAEERRMHAAAAAMPARADVLVADLLDFRCGARLFASRAYVCSVHSTDIFLHAVMPWNSQRTYF